MKSVNLSGVFLPTNFLESMHDYNVRINMAI